MIQPTPQDIGRRVKIEPFNAEPEYGVLKEVIARDHQRPNPFAMVRYDGRKFNVATDLKKLSWAD